MAYIYKITNKITGRIYVGKTKKTLEERYSEHITNGRKIEASSKISKSLRIYGTINHIIEIIEECSEENVFVREQYWIDTLNTLHVGLNIKNEKLTQQKSNYWGNEDRAFENISKGIIWNKGISPQEKTREKISKTKLKRSKLGLYKNSYRRYQTEETKRKLSEIAKKRPPVKDEIKKKISQNSKGREFFYSYNDKKRVFILPENCPEGYVRGKGQLWVMNDYETKCIDVWDLEHYVKRGYREGRCLKKLQKLKS
jgi:group I intron endonuclease